MFDSELLNDRERHILAFGSNCVKNSGSLLGGIDGGSVNRAILELLMTICELRHKEAAV